MKEEFKYDALSFRDPPYEVGQEYINEIATYYVDGRSTKKHIIIGYEVIRPDGTGSGGAYPVTKEFFRVGDAEFDSLDEAKGYIIDSAIKEEAAMTKTQEKKAMSNLTKQLEIFEESIKTGCTAKWILCDLSNNNCDICLMHGSDVFNSDKCVYYNLLNTGYNTLIFEPDFMDKKYIKSFARKHRNYIVRQIKEKGYDYK